MARLWLAVALAFVACGRSEIPLESFDAGPIVRALDAGLGDAGVRDAGVDDCRLPSICANACIGTQGIRALACGANQLCCVVRSP